MKVLFIGGTGNISTAVSTLAIERGIELYLLNRGIRKIEIPGTKTITADIHDKEQTKNALKDSEFDVVVNWIAYVPEDIERDIELFTGKTKQYIFISSASAYQKPLDNPIITESTPMINPFWQYSRDKIACEERLLEEYQKNGFPGVIVRPSLTYDKVFPLAIGGWDNFTLVDRMRHGKRIISHGDGQGLWVITHAADFAKGFIGLFGNPKTIGEAFHITSDEILTWDKIYQTVAEVAGTTANIVHIPTDFIKKIKPEMGPGLDGDKANCPIFDNSKIKAFVPDFKATISFKEGIRKTVEWFEADPERIVIVDRINQNIDDILNAWDKAMAAVDN